MNRKFVRQSLGGVHDEADIAVIAAPTSPLPGNIIQGIAKPAPIIPCSCSMKRPSRASFHAIRRPPAGGLGSAQNTSFQDHYLGVDLI